MAFRFFGKFKTETDGRAPKPRTYMDSFGHSRITDGTRMEPVYIAGKLDALSVTTEVEKLTESIMRAGVLPPKAIRDAFA